jgi:hypothetical protein
MPVTDDLREIAERADRELDAIHDFFEHSKIACRAFQILVGEGHKVSAENPASRNGQVLEGPLCVLTPVRSTSLNHPTRRGVSSPYHRGIPPA